MILRVVLTRSKLGIELNLTELTCKARNDWYYVDSKGGSRVVVGISS